MRADSRLRALIPPTMTHNGRALCHLFTYPCLYLTFCPTFTASDQPRAAALARSVVRDSSQRGRHAGAAGSEARGTSAVGPECHLGGRTHPDGARPHPRPGDPRRKQRDAPVIRLPICGEPPATRVGPEPDLGRYRLSSSAPLLGYPRLRPHLRALRQHGPNGSCPQRRAVPGLYPPDLLVHDLLHHVDNHHVVVYLDHVDHV